MKKKEERKVRASTHKNWCVETLRGLCASPDVNPPNDLVASVVTSDHSIEEKMKRSMIMFNAT